MRNRVQSSGFRVQWAAVLLTLVLAPLASAANVRWTGAAQDVRGVWTIAVTGTWATGDTATLTLNNKSVTVTIGSATTTANVADVLARAVDAANATEDLLGNETRNFGGEEIPEFAELDASASASTLTITTEEPGVSLTASSGSLALTRTEATAGDGALGAVTQVTAATGKNWFNNAANWEGGALPAATDTLVFDSGDVDVLHGLSNTTLDYDLRRTNGYSGDIGLTKINDKGYVEYRTRFLALPITATTGSETHYIGGESAATASGRTYLNFGTNDPSTIVVNVRDAADVGADGPAVQIVGGQDIILNAYRGSVGVGTNVGQTASNLARVFINYVANRETDANVRIGSNATFDNVADSIDQSGGTLTLDCTCSGGNNEIFVNAGTLVAEATSAANIVYVYGGRVDFRGSTVATVHVLSGGEFDLSASPSVVISNPIELYRGFTFRDPHFRMSGLSIRFDFNGCTPSDGTLQVRNNLSMVPAEL